MASTDHAVLVALYHSTGGRNWNTAAELSQWYGVEANNEGRVVKLFLHDNSLQGILFALSTRVALFRSAWYYSRARELTPMIPSHALPVV